MHLNDKIQLLHQVWNSENGIQPKKSHELEVPKLEDIITKVFSSGLYYTYIIDFFDRSISNVNKSILDIHGFDLNKVTLNDIIGSIHPDDMHHVAKCEEILLEYFYKAPSPLNILDYKTTYYFRMMTTEGKYHLFQHNVVILNTDDKGAVCKAFNIHIDVDHIMSQNNGKVTFMGLYGNDHFFSVEVGAISHKENKSINPFTKRERQIVAAMAEGKTSKEMADFFKISVDTVMNHRKNILSKAQCNSTPQLITKAIKEGWL